MPASARLGDRSLFPQLSATAYLNHAAISPPCLPVQRAVTSAMELYGEHGVTAFPELQEQRQRLKQQLSLLIGASGPEEIGLVPNTSRGISEIALCLPWRSGDRILLFEGEFPANVTPWQQAAKLFQLEISYHQADDLKGAAGLERLEQELKRGVRLVAVSFVQFQTGLRVPLKQIGQLCARYGAELCVDAIQGLGVVPLDVNECGVHYLSCGGHKWLLGFEGAGFLFARRACAAKFRQYTAGWLSHEEPLRFLFDGAGHLRYDRPITTDVSCVEGGTQNVLGYAALAASIPLLLELTPSGIFAHLDAYLSLLEAGLCRREFSSLRAACPSLRSTILCALPPKPMCALAIQRGLSARGIVCGVPYGNLRFAPHFANNESELSAVFDALDDTLSEQTV